jgi:hypothetical protein
MLSSQYDAYACSGQPMHSVDIYTTCALSYHLSIVPLCCIRTEASSAAFALSFAAHILDHHPFDIPKTCCLVQACHQSRSHAISCNSFQVATRCRWIAAIHVLI